MLKKSVDESIEHLLPWMPWAKFEPETIDLKEDRVFQFRKRFLAHDDYTMAIFNLNETGLLGSTGLHTRLPGNALEVGYWVNVNQAGKGLCTHVVTALTKVGFEVEGLDNMVIKCEVDNAASRRVAEKCGYNLVGTQSNFSNPYDRLLRTMNIFEITRGQYFQNPVQLPIQVYDTDGLLIL
jgi:RimJ/RimL family protein N-acetyltransferase